MTGDRSLAGRPRPGGLAGELRAAVLI